MPLAQTDPPVTGLLLLLGLSFFFGFAFEEFYRKSGQQRPGGVQLNTATTVVLTPCARTNPSILNQARAGITLATAIMYLRMLAIVAVFNWTLARTLALPFVGLSLVGLACAGLQYRLALLAALGVASALIIGGL